MTQPYTYPQSLSLADYSKEETYRYTRAPVNMAMTLLADAYRKADFFQLEQHRVYGSSWVVAGYTSQVAKTGQVMVTDIAGQSIIITRDKTGKLNAFYNVCRHRGARLVQEDCQLTRFRCPYHSWGFDLTGKCIGTPLFEGSDIPEDFQGVFDMSEVKAFDREDYGLFPVQVDTWGFFIFVNLDPDAMPLSRWLGDLPDRMQNHRLHEWRIMREKDYPIEANWKLIAENFMEYYHLPWVHPDLAKVSRVEDHYRFQGTGMYTGMCTYPISPNSDAGGWDGLPPVSGLRTEEAQRGLFISLFPNICISVLPNHAFVMLFKPERAGFTLEKTALLCHPETAQGENADQALDALMQFWNMVNMEDVDIVQVVQQGLGNEHTPYKGGRMCFKFEESVHRFQNMIIDRMVGIKDHVPTGDSEEIVQMFGQPVTLG